MADEIVKVVPTPINPIQVKGAIAFSAEHSRVWAEGADEEVEKLGGEHSAKGWANISKTAAESESVQTVVSNLEDISAVANNISDVINVSSISSDVSTVATHDDEIVLVSNDIASVSAVGNNISDVNTVASSISTITAVAESKTNIDNVAADLTNIDAVAASLPDIQDKQNKVLTNSVVLGGETQTTVEGALEAISEEWAKPTDWIDIRSGALDESVYFLVGHSADYSSYPKWAISANVSNSGTYDIFADGIKVATSSSGDTTTIDWQTLALTSGFDVTYPTALRTHIVRVAPSLNTNTITAIRHRPISGQTAQCDLWVHFTTSNFLNVSAFTGNTSNTYSSPLLDAITSKNDELNITIGTYSSASGITGFLNRASTIKKIPTLVGNLPDVKNYVYYALNCGSSYLKKLKLKQINTDYTILKGSYFEEIETDIPMIMATGVVNDDALLQYRSIKKIPLSTFIGDTRHSFHMTQMENLESTVLDFSSAAEEKYINVSGTSAHAPRGIKGLTVSSSAPFDSTTSPQINVAYTGMDRGALVALFNSLPTVTAGQVCNVTGATGAADLTATDLAIANNKGWTVTR